MSGPWVFWALAWAVIGLAWGVVVLYRRPQARGATCLFIPSAIFAGPLLILLDLLVWCVSRFERAGGLDFEDPT